MKNLLVIGVVALLVFLLCKNKVNISVNGNNLLPLSNNPLPSTPPTTPGSTTIQPSPTNGSNIVVVDNSNGNGYDYLSGPDDLTNSGTFTV